MIARCLGIVCLLAVASAALAAPTIEATLTSPETPWHRAFLYSLTIEGDAALHCEFPDIPVEAAHVEASRLKLESVPTPDGGIRLTKTYQIDPLFPGHYIAPSIDVAWQSGDNEGVLTTPPMMLHARELTDAEMEALAHFAGIAAPDAVLPPPRVSTRLVLTLITLGLVALAGVIAAVVYLRRTREEPVVVLPPWETALNRLRELERRNLPGAGKIDAYYVDLSAILRYYIEDRFRIHAPEQTTPEFLDTAAQSRVFSEEQQQFLAAFLRQCDRVKFARLQPAAEEMITHFKEVRRFVRETVPLDLGDASLEQAA